MIFLILFHNPCIASHRYYVKITFKLDVFFSIACCISFFFAKEISSARFQVKSFSRQFSRCCCRRRSFILNFGRKFLSSTFFFWLLVQTTTRVNNLEWQRIMHSDLHMGSIWPICNLATLIGVIILRYQTRSRPC